MKHFRIAIVTCCLLLCAFPSKSAVPGPSPSLPQVLYNSGTYPHDWTEGSGTLGSSGQITIPAPSYQLFTPNPIRRWIFIQNQSASTITIQYEGRLANGTTQSFISFLLAPGTSAGTQGSSDERGFSAFVPQGIVKVIGAANAQVAVAEVVE